MLCRHTQFKPILIFAPRWHDRRVLIATYKVGEHNKITFSKTPSLPDVYYLSKKDIPKYKKESNGTIQCYCVPIDDLKILEIPDKCVHDYN